MPQQPPHHAGRRGFTLIETMVSIVIVSVMYAAALHTVGATRVAEALIADQRRGHELARQLMSEIIALPYRDPVSDTGVLGPRATEEAAGNRSLFNDVDDYDNWTEQPPQLKEGTKLTGLDDWERTVKVVWIDPDNLDNTRSTETGLKRITVTVSRRDKVIATLHALKADVD